jgi:HTH-type transcriptional regulator / antitoxin HigA
MRTTAPHRDDADTYFELVRRFPLRPIRSESELKRAAAILIKLLRSRPEEEMDAGERDYIEALSMLVQRFELGRRDSALPRLTPIERLKFLLEQGGMNVSDLGRVIGSQPAASLILHGRRAMSKTQMLKLARYFSVSPALFME